MKKKGEEEEEKGTGAIQTEKEKEKERKAGSLAYSRRATDNNKAGQLATFNNIVSSDGLVCTFFLLYTTRPSSA